MKGYLLYIIVLPARLSIYKYIGCLSLHALAFPLYMSSLPESSNHLTMALPHYRRHASIYMYKECSNAHVHSQSARQLTNIYGHAVPLSSLSTLREVSAAKSTKRFDSCAWSSESDLTGLTLGVQGLRLL